MEDENGWEFNAPQFVDFTGGSSLLQDDNADSYFDYDHENGIAVVADDEEDVIESDVFSTPQTEVLKNTRSASVKKAAVEEVTQTPSPRVTRSTKTPNSVVVKEETQTPSLRVTRAAKTPNSAVVKEEKSISSPKITRSGRSLGTPKVPEVNKEAQSKPNNICNNLDEWRKKTAGSKVIVKSNNGRDPVVATQAGNTEKAGSKRHHRSLERSDSLPKKAKVVPGAERGRSLSKAGGSNLQRSSSFSNVRTPSANSATKKHTRGLSSDRTLHTRSNSNVPVKQVKPNLKSKITIPLTPEIMRRNAAKLHTVKNTEEMELEKIAHYRQEMAKRLKQNEESCKAALSGPGPAAVLAHKEVTCPRGFQFETDNRVKSHNMETRQDADVKDFASMLRSAKNKQAAAASVKTGPTKPEPFHFSSQRKKDEKQPEKYTTVAEQLKAFNATPERFKSKPKVDAKQTRGRSRSPPKGITIPKTPQFETRTRRRPVTAPSKEELEKKEYEESQRHQFKAHPVNQKILQNPSCGVKKVPSKPVTVPEGFHLSNDKRAASHDRDLRSKASEQYEFHAQPLNKKILEGTVGLKEAKKLPITIPESPAFALKHRARIPVQEEPKEEKSICKPRGVPHFGIPFQPQLSRKATEPAPFTFDKRDRKRAELKAQKIEQVYDEENRQREFHANPIPSLEPNLPPKRKCPLTEHQPFNLDTENRGMRKAEEWKQKMEEELRQQKEKSKFKAREPHVLEHEPFKPVKDHKYTTEISEFELNTAKRTLKREAFEMHKKARQDEIDNIRHQEQLMKEAEEKAELERLRKEAVHRANPVKYYKRMELHPSGKPLTDPHSPRFKTDARLRSRALHADSMTSISSS